VNRRNFIGGIMAAVALATGLARTRLDLVDDERRAYVDYGWVHVSDLPESLWPNPILPAVWGVSRAN